MSRKVVSSSITTTGQTNETVIEFDNNVINDDDERVIQFQDYKAGIKKPVTHEWINIPEDMPDVLTDIMMSYAIPYGGMADEIIAKIGGNPQTKSNFEHGISDFLEDKSYNFDKLVKFNEDFKEVAYAGGIAPIHLQSIEYSMFEQSNKERKLLEEDGKNHDITLYSRMVKNAVKHNSLPLVRYALKISHVNIKNILSEYKGKPTYSYTYLLNLDALSDSVNDITDGKKMMMKKLLAGLIRPVDMTILSNIVLEAIIETDDIVPNKYAIIRYLEAGLHNHYTDYEGKIAYNNPISYLLHNEKIVTLELIQIFVENGFDIKKNNIIRDYAIIYDSKEALKIIKYLVKNGADIFYIDDDGNNLIHYFSLNEIHIPILKYLLSLGLDKELRNNKGETPLMRYFRILMGRPKSKEIIKLLSL